MMIMFLTNWKSKLLWVSTWRFTNYSITYYIFFISVTSPEHLLSLTNGGSWWNSSSGLHCANRMWQNTCRHTSTALSYRRCPHWCSLAPSPPTLAGCLDSSWILHTFLYHQTGKIKHAQIINGSTDWHKLSTNKLSKKEKMY